MRSFALALLVALIPVGGLAQTEPVAPKRIIVERDVDFFGADLRSLFDTTFEACRTACLSDSECRAFTFNSRSNSCFPKSEVTDRTAYEGALSAIVVAQPADLTARAVERLSDLAFLSPSDISNARAEADAMPLRHTPGSWSEADLVRGAQDARAAGNHSDALRWLGPAIVLSDRSAHWLDYASDALLAQGATDDQTRALRARALPAALNAFLRASGPQEEAASLFVLAKALEASGRGRAMIPALELAEKKMPDERFATALNDAIGKYGFRIVDTRVESDSAQPRICAQFSETLDNTLDYEPYVQLPGVSFAAEASGQDLCIDGLTHGARYRITFRAGLPDATGRGLRRDVTQAAYVRDRSPAVRFPGRAYVLPRSPEATLPIVTVNTTEVDLALFAVADRNLLRLVQEGFFGRPLDQWDARRFEAELAEAVWEGQGETSSRLNEDVTTQLPMAEALEGRAPGLYALQASVRGEDPYDVPSATQWFVVSDIGVATLSGTDGLHVFARSLGNAEPLEGLEAQLLSRSNRVLATATTGVDGYALFDRSATEGRGAASPAMVMLSGQDDFAFLSLTDPEFDLSDRGVEGRPAAGSVDVFLATDRGAYRAGETVHVTALARNSTAEAIPGLPLTAVLTRPDGVEYSRHTSSDGRAGGHVFALPTSASVPRGAWTLAIHLDPEAPALAQETLLVEDFLPERIDFEIGLPEGPVSINDAPSASIEARYLFGAPAADLPVEGSVLLRAASALEAFPGYRFGRYDDPFTSWVTGISADNTDAGGFTTAFLDFGDFDIPARPMEAAITVRVSEGSGRPVERRETLPLSPGKPMIGIRPLFDSVLPEGSEANFAVIGLDAGGAQTEMRVKWSLNRVETRYQWYSQYGDWNWEPITRRTRIATGETTLGTTPADIAAPVDWGQYELVVERLDGDYVASSVDFFAGWYAPADGSSTPDTLDVSLDAESYRPGDTATLRIDPRYEGKALVSVVSNRLIARRMVDVSGETLIDLPVTEDWGAGAYVSATLIRPMDAPSGRNPARALGIAYAAVDPGPRQLQVRFETASEAAPRGPLEAVLRIDRAVEGETVYATIAAVDEGILNLTGFEAPDPEGHYFGQRQLGVGMRDLYGRLIDGLAGEAGAIRSGGDGAQAGLQSPPPTEELVASFSGPLIVGEDGTARATFDLPSFNGTVKLMAVAWSATAVGSASKDVLVRDPIVVTATLPRFLAPGDSSSMLVEVTHATGPTGPVTLALETAGLTLVDGTGPWSAFSLGEGRTERFRIPFGADDRETLATVDLTLTTPEGTNLSKQLVVPAQVNDPETSRTSRFPLAAGQTLTLSDDLFADLRPGTGTATVALGPLGRFDAPGLLAALDRYPYGCTEQTTSRALPLLYFDEVAEAMGIAEGEQIDDRIADAIGIIASRQNSSGGFGLWQTWDSDFWLDAYVTDFLSRARSQGHEVPERAFSMAIDNLRNRVNAAPDFDADVNSGGTDIAYALLVLARESAAQMGDLRYFADAKAQDFGTPLAAAQLGAALALYGDQPRADRMFARAAELMRADESAETLWRADYGTGLRDAAGVLTLAAEAGTTTLDLDALAQRVAAPTGTRSTQEASWSLLAAHALVEETGSGGFTLDGNPVEGPLVRVIEDQTNLSPVSLTNGTDREAELTLTTFGVPLEPEPATANGYRIDRSYYTLDGDPADTTTVKRGTRLVTVLTVTPFGKREARLIINDPLPAGFEIDNPNLIRGGDIRALDWLEPANARHAEFRQERFLGAVDWRSDRPFQIAYIVRAISPGTYHHPAALVEDMYRPQFRATTDARQLTVAE